jgi:hypothetical protein
VSRHRRLSTQLFSIDNVQNTLPLLSLLFERLEQEHVVDITEEDFDGHIDDSIQVGVWI